MIPVSEHGAVQETAAKRPFSGWKPPRWLVVAAAIAGLAFFFVADDLLVVLLAGKLQLFGWPGLWYWLAAAVISFLNVSLAVVVYRALRQRPVTGAEGMIGRTGRALQSFSAEGQVLVRDEIWRAATEEPLRKGDRVEVVASEGLTLLVRKRTEKRPSRN